MSKGCTDVAYETFSLTDNYQDTQAKKNDTNSNWFTAHLMGDLVQIGLMLGRGYSRYIEQTGASKKLNRNT